MLGKSAENKNYTLCQLRSWVSPNCSTQFNISGTAGANMEAHCEDNQDKNAYRRSFPPDQGWSPPSLDWKVSLTWHGAYKVLTETVAR